MAQKIIILFAFLNFAAMSHGCMIGGGNWIEFFRPGSNIPLARVNLIKLTKI